MILRYWGWEPHHINILGWDTNQSITGLAGAWEKEHSGGSLVSLLTINMLVVQLKGDPLVLITEEWASGGVCTSWNTVNVPYRREDSSSALTSLRRLSWSHSVTRWSEYLSRCMTVFIYFFQNILWFTRSCPLSPDQLKLVRPLVPQKRVWEFIGVEGEKSLVGLKQKRCQVRSVWEGFSRRWDVALESRL